MADAVLVFPPVWTTDLPYLSLPALKAFARSAGYDVRCIDANLAFWRWLTSTEQLPHLAAAARSLRKAHFRDADPSLAAALVAASAGRRAFEPEDVARLPRNVLRKLAAGHAPLGLETRGLTEPHAHAGTMSQQDHHDRITGALALRCFASRSEDVLPFACGGRITGYTAFFRDHVLPEIERARPTVVGVGLTSSNQVVPGLILAGMVRRELPGAHVTIGGAWVSHLGEAIPARLFDVVDSAILYAGEEPLVALIQALAAGRGLDGVPALVRRIGGRVHASPPRHARRLDDLPTPDFTDHALSSYDLPFVLPLQGCRGCYWARCTFCSYPVTEPVYAARSPGLVAADMEKLAASTGSTRFAFVDAAMPPPWMRGVAEAVRARDLRVAWSGFARFERAFTPELLRQVADAGLTQVVWGLETASPRLLQMIDKTKMSPGAIGRALNAAHAAGIKNRVCIMYGLPGETKGDVERTVAFLRENLSFIDSLSVSRFAVERNTPMADRPASFGLGALASDGDLSLGFDRLEPPDDEEALAQADERLRHLAAVCAQRSGRAQWNTALVAPP